MPELMSTMESNLVPPVEQPQPEPQTSTISTRIPTSLQEIFLASNGGAEVHKPPPGLVAQKVFRRNWFMQMGSSKGLFASAHRVLGGGAGSHGSLSNSGDESSRIRTSSSFKRPSSFKDGTRKEALKGHCLSEMVDLKQNPQDFLDSVLRARGYSTKTYKTLQSAYYNKPTPLQLASYDLYLIRLLRESNEDAVAEIISSGVSPNPSNKFGETLVHMVCRRGDYKLLKVLVQNGANLQIADDYGRTPMHDACWAANPNFDVVRMILQFDLRLFHMVDSRGALPLSYVCVENRAEWNQWIATHLDMYWPYGGSVDDIGEEDPPALTLEAPHSRPMPSPKNALPIEVARMVVSGKITPEEALYLVNDATADESESDVDSDEEETEDGGVSDESDGDEDEESDDDDDETTSSDYESSSSQLSE